MSTLRHMSRLDEPYTAWGLLVHLLINKFLLKMLSKWCGHEDMRELMIVYASSSEDQNC